LSGLVYPVITWAGRHVLLPVYADVRAAGLENVPPDGPLLIASNHLSDCDPGILSTRIPRQIAFMAKAELFRVPLLAQFLRAHGAFPVRRHQADLSTLRRAGELLREGRAVCVFPEGTRSGREARLTEGWPGAALIALREDAPVLPVAITGSGKLNFPGMLVRFYDRAHVKLTVGEPFRLPRPARVNAEAAREGTRQIMERIALLLPPENRGYYGYVAEAQTTGNS
jgi:1-acyl-sn-glycerol-3-phosphate acyltransferase